MKKIMIRLLAGVMCLSLCGCIRRKPHIPNEKRGNEYTYDFIDYVDIHVFGQDGDGYLEVKPKDISVRDFMSEGEYIGMKKDLDRLALYLIQGKDYYTSNLSASKSTGLSNGDIVTLSIRFKEPLLMDINIEPYEYTVEGLGELKSIDLFGKKNVTFFATKDGMCYAHVLGKDMPEDLAENILYRISSDGTLETGKTILSVEADMDEGFLEEKEYHALKIYLAKNRLKGDTETEKVLNTIVDPINFSGLASAAVESALYDRLYQEEGSYLGKVCSLQKLPRQISEEPYGYTAVYYNMENGTPRYYRRGLKMVYVDGEFLVLELERRDSVEAAYAGRAFPDGEMVLNYMTEKTGEGKPAKEQKEETVLPGGKEKEAEKQPAEEGGDMGK